MSGLKSLAKDTVIYGLSSIIGRFLNYLLVPIYTTVLPSSSGGYGVVSNVYAYTALILVILTFGMETGFFRFANKEGEDAKAVYDNVLMFVGGLGLIFLTLCISFISPISSFLGYPEHHDFILMMAMVVALDAFQCIPFAYLRYEKRPFRFAFIKLVNIIGIIFFNIFFLIVCPSLYEHSPQLVSWFYMPDYTIGYIFVSNLLMTSVQLLLFIPELRQLRFRFDWSLQRRIIMYSFPILIFGIVGILNQTVDKIIYPFLFEERQEGFVQLGIYSAACKVAMIMAIFTQAFRYAYEPFVFGKQGDKDSKEMYSKAMKYFLIFSLLAFLCVMYYLDILKYMIASDYWAGLSVVSIVIWAEIFKGVYFNLSFWYKLTDETRWGAYFSLVGFVVIMSLNIWLVPYYGYVASAWASVVGYGLITLMSYFIGQRKYPIEYPLKDMSKYLLLTVILYALGIYVPIDSLILRILYRSVLLFIFVGYILRTDLPLRSIPVVNRLVKK